MHIVVLTMSYAPDVAGIAPKVTEVCEYLVSAGHRVSVLTGPPHYPQWKIPDGYKGKLWLRENINGVAVHRTYVYVPSRRSTIRRIVYDSSLAVSSIFSGLITERAQLVLVFSPPLQLGLTGLLLSRLSGSPLVLNVQDIVPDLAIAVGMLRNPWAIKAAHLMERYIYHKAAAIVVICQGFVKNLKSKGIAESKLILNPNSVDTDATRPMARDGQWRKNFNLAEDQFLVLHTGNMGAKQKLANVLDAAAALRKERNILFVLVGDGTEKRTLEAYKQQLGLSNVLFLPFQPAEMFSDMLSCADVLLLNQSAAVVDMVIPSKLLTYMAAGRPIVAAANEQSDAADCIRSAQCGPIVPPDDPDALAAAILGVYGDSQLADRWGESGRKYVEKHFAREPNMRFFEGVLNTIASGGQPRSSIAATMNET